MANTKIKIQPGLVKDIAGNNNNAITTAQNVNNFTPQIRTDFTAPELVTWTLNLNTAELVLNFSEGISFIDLTKLRIYNSNIGSHTLTTTHDITSGPINNLTITLNTTDKDAIEIATGNSTPVFIAGVDGWAIDEATNEGIAFNLGSTSFTPIPDTTPPELISWDLDIESAIVRLNTSEELDILTPNRLTIKGTGISNHTINSTTIRLSGTNSYVIDLDSTDITALTPLTGDVLLDGVQNWADDISKNEGLAFTDRPVNSFTLKFIPAPVPTLLSWELDLDNSIATFTFDTDINHTNVNTQDMNIVGINGQISLESSTVTSSAGPILTLEFTSSHNESIKQVLNNAVPASLTANKGFVSNTTGQEHEAIISPTNSANFNNDLFIGQSILTLTTTGTTSIIPSPSIKVGNLVLTNTGQTLQPAPAISSPNVTTSINDNANTPSLSQIITTASTSKAAFVGEFSWGPENEITNISSIGQLTTKFGNPVGEHSRDWNTVYNFLSYGNKSIDVIRIGADRFNQISTISDTTHARDSEDLISAKYKGILGNSIGVMLLKGSAQFDTVSALDGAILPTNIFDTAPTSDEIHIIVYDATGNITNNPGTILETFAYLSSKEGSTDADNIGNYYKSVLESRSNYIKAGDNNITRDVIINEVLANGTDAIYSSTNLNVMTSSTTFTTASGKDALDIQAFELLKDQQTSDVGIFICGDKSITVQKYLHDMVANKADAIAIFSPAENAKTTADAIEHFSTFNSSSYSIFLSGWKTQIDTFTGSSITLPLDGDIAALLAQTDSRNDPWWSPAGYNRGLIRNVTSLVNNPDSTDRDNLYQNRINPIVSSEGSGTLLFGDRTALSAPSAFDRINIRRLFNILKKSISESANYQLFEFNDDFTRANFQITVESFLSTIKTGRGIQDFYVEVSNDPQIINSNQFVADIYVKPTRAINFVKLNFIAVRTGVTFDEVIDATNANN